MKTYTSAYFESDQPCVTALGCFDGVHIGHAHLIGEAKRISLQLGAKTAVWSFDAPPKNYFSPTKIPLLTVRSEKQIAMRRLGVDVFVCVPFDETVSSLSAEEFFNDVLVKKMKSVHVVCGYNYRFGKGGKGDLALLERLCSQNKIGLSVVPEVKLADVTVSSSEIRKALVEGRLDDANAMLDRPYSLRARVSDGQHLGRQLGFPTINQIFPPEKLLPLHGVYVSRVLFGGKVRYGITNIGIRPTVNGSTLCAETNIFDFNGDLYGRTATVELLAFLRAEQKFSSLDELKNQVDADIARAKNIIKAM